MQRDAAAAAASIHLHHTSVSYPEINGSLWTAAASTLTLATHVGVSSPPDSSRTSRVPTRLCEVVAVVSRVSHFRLRTSLGGTLKTERGKKKNID